MEKNKEQKVDTKVDTLTPAPLKEEVKPAVVVKEAKTVEVDKDALDKVLDRLDRLEDENKVLLSVADKGRLAKYQSQNPDSQTTTVKVSRYPHKGEPKNIVAWKTVIDEVYQDPITRAWRENQVTQIFFEDGESLSIPYLEFVRGVDKVEAEVISRTKDSKGEIVNIRLKDGKELSLDIRYVN